MRLLVLPFFLSALVLLAPVTKIPRRLGERSVANAAVVAPLPLLAATPPLGSGVLTTVLSYPASPGSVGGMQRLALWEHARPVYFGEVQRQFTLREGRWQGAVRVAGDPGQYDIRIVSQSRDATPLTQAAVITFTGVNRTPGWWLIDGSPIIAPATEVTPDAALNVAGPLFLSGLQRDLGKKPTVINKSFSVASAARLQWRTLPLPPLATMLRPDFDMAALRSQLLARMKELQGVGTSGLVGFSLSVGLDQSIALPPLSPFDIVCEKMHLFAG